ncbi:class I SAM-dependent methyltransferase [Chloroflexota bacterium]
MKHKGISDDEHRKRYSDTIRDARLAGDNQFQNWFNKSKDVHQSIVRGYWDLTTHILTPKVCKYIENPEEKTALEIGYGGGRILNAACGYFKQVLGIDIHEEQEKVDTFLRFQGKSNFKLIKTSGRTIDVESETIDFLYSFITLQHLPSFQAFNSYITEAYRCLKAGGIAQLYFGKYGKLNLVDRLRFFIQGHKEITDAKPNYTSLVIRVLKLRNYVEKLASKLLMLVLHKRASLVDIQELGGQNYLTLLKYSNI